MLRHACGYALFPAFTTSIYTSRIFEGIQHGSSAGFNRVKRPFRLSSGIAGPRFLSRTCNRCEGLMPEVKKARAMGFNHIALEVGDIEEALAFYGRIFEFQLRGKDEDMAFIDLGDQFLALQKGRKQPSDDGRHFGLVVDDKDAVRRALAEAGVEVLPGPFLDFRDPWGNRVEIVGYDNIQFSKAPNVLRGMGLAHLAKNAKAIKELAEKGMAPD
jgi:lactoylglutathione lyase